MRILKGTQDHCDSNGPHNTVRKKHCFKQIFGTISEGIGSHFSWQSRKAFLGHTRTILWEDDASVSSQSHSGWLETHQAFSSLHENIHTSFATQPIYRFLCVSPFQVGRLIFTIMLWVIHPVEMIKQVQRGSDIHSRRPDGCSEGQHHRRSEGRSHRSRSRSRDRSHRHKRSQHSRDRESSNPRERKHH